VWLAGVPVAGLVAGLLAFGGVAGAAPAQAGLVAALHMVNWNLSPSGGPLCLGITGGDSNAPAVQWTCDAGHPDQEWYEGAEYGTTGFYQLKNATGSGQCLGVAAASTAEGAQVVGWDCLPSHLDQYWYPLASCGDGAYEAWLNLGAWTAGKEYVFGVTGNSNAVGAPVILWQYQGACNNQYWTLPG
jgi:hypothetical protein